MKDEIKEILQMLEAMASNDDIAFLPKQASLLLDYISNLQEENERLKLVIKNHSIIIPKNKVIDYKSRIEKAIEYINKYPVNSCYKLLDILQGVGK